MFSVTVQSSMLGGSALRQTNFNYYQGLTQAGLIGLEVAYQDLTIASTVTRGVADAIDASSGVASAIAN